MAEDTDDLEIPRLLAPWLPRDDESTAGPYNNERDTAHPR